MNILLYEGTNNELEVIGEGFRCFNLVTNNIPVFAERLTDYISETLLENDTVNVIVVFRSKGIFKDSSLRTNLLKIYDIFSVFDHEIKSLNFTLVTNVKKHKQLHWDGRKINVNVFKLTFSDQFNKLSPIGEADVTYIKI